MAETFSRKRPTFDQFRIWFLEEVMKHTTKNVPSSFMSWSDVGSTELRKEIIESFMQTLESKFGFRPVFKEDISKMNGSLESVVITIFHVFSTMFLVDHINEKMYKQRDNKMH